MAFTGIMCTEADIDGKTGAGVSASWTDVMKTAETLMAESFVNIVCRKNYSDSYASLNVDVKYLLTEIVSSLVAIQGIAYDMSGYTSRIEAEDKINVLRDAGLRAISIIRDKETQRFINGA